MAPKKRLPQRVSVSRGNRLYDLVNDCDEVVRAGTRDDAKRDGLWRRAVHIFVFNRENKLLICGRPPTTRAYPNLVTSSAGGKVERGEGYKSAARRELFEELGVRSRLRHIGRFDVASHRHGKMIHHLFAARAETVDPHAAEIAWSAFTDLRELARDVVLRPRRYAKPFRAALAAYLGHRKPLTRR